MLYVFILSPFSRHTVVEISADTYSVPVEAFARNDPYPFGIDPVSLFHNQLVQFTFAVLL